MSWDVSDTQRLDPTRSVIGDRTRRRVGAASAPRHDGLAAASAMEVRSIIGANS